MADIQALELMDKEIQVAEAMAIRGVAAHMRAAVLDLPSESRLGLILVQHANKLDTWAQGSAPAIWTNASLDRLHQDLDGLHEDEGGDA
jgi:hypothetical protein